MFITIIHLGVVSLQLILFTQAWYKQSHTHLHRRSCLILHQALLVSLEGKAQMLKVLGRTTHGIDLTCQLSLLAVSYQFFLL